MQFPLNIKKVVVLTCDGADEVLLHFEGTTSFPKLSAQLPTEYNPLAKIQAEKGYGREWVRKLGISDDLVQEIDVTAGPKRT